MKTILANSKQKIIVGLAYCKDNINVTESLHTIVNVITIVLFARLISL